MQRDPIWPQTGEPNPYKYAGNGPTNATDPSGLKDEDEDSDTVTKARSKYAALLRERGAGHPLLVTTGYELALEQALSEAGEEFDTVCYVAAGRYRGGFCHVSPSGVATPIERPNRYATELSLERRTAVLHLQGRLDPSSERAWESFAVLASELVTPRILICPSDKARNPAADFSDQPLRDDEIDCRCHYVRCNTHFHQANNCLRSIVRMKGADNHVTC